MGDKKDYNYLIEDIGMLIFLATIFFSVLIVCNSEKEFLLENNIMILIMFLSIICAVFLNPTVGIIISASAILIFTAYKLFNMYAYGIKITAYSYPWLILPVTSVGAITLYKKGSEKIEIENNILRKQVEDLIMIDPLTGLYNINSFYHDVLVQIQYTKRNNIPFTLMVVKLRYEQELRRVFSPKNYELILKRLAEILQDVLRLEDKIYSLDENGEFGAILTCDGEGANIVKNRLRANIEKKEAFDGITSKSIRVSVQIAFVQYNVDMGNDIMGYKEQVESELQYDV